jgi:bridging integrator 3
MGRYEKEVQALQKEAKLYTDSMRGQCGRCVEPGWELIYVFLCLIAMVQAQGRIAETIDVFYGAADRTSEGAMAANAYKRSVDELEAATNREFVRSRLNFYAICDDADGGHL